MVSSLEPQIAQGCRALGVAADERAPALLAAFLRLLHKWNRVYNLTAVRDPQAMVARHVLDSLAVLPWLTRGTLLDVGTGAGLPGLVLAIARPELEVTLLDSNAKKLRFVRQAAAELGLANTTVVQARMQEYQPGRSFDMVISRAVASMEELYRHSHHLLRPGGRMLFMKGALPQQELEQLAPQAGPLHVETLDIPGLEAERHLLWLEKA
ncbi:MAG TPA: 16S rRNA (guanine(527)-N(7))-methyltransferase RsmG [Gammaproteobacteria bacterium]|nr:16S rRNA (guanine(527)-N(7))-methyltransferase RsmG [Gammaproteobacteria bacterium]